MKDANISRYNISITEIRLKIMQRGVKG